MHELYLFHFQKHVLLARIQKNVKVSDFVISYARQNSGGGGWAGGDVVEQEPGSMVGGTLRTGEELADRSEGITKVEGTRTILQRCTIFCTKRAPRDGNRQGTRANQE